jgi:hypothetical protein
MISKGWQSKVDFAERVMSNCFACGLPVDHIRTRPGHAPEPESEADRCHSRPKKYNHLRCMYAAGHECAHTANVAGTGKHFWSDRDGA